MIRSLSSWMQAHPQETVYALVLSSLFSYVVFLGIVPATDLLPPLSPALSGLAVGLTGVVSFLVFARLAAVFVG